ncbi:MAG: glycogen synthase GlgA [Denitrovibrio sp.]|nr:MAG: glycogen synthase GlgA [Denitrovibrio sp.]
MAGMNILFASSEAAPYAKTGGLADVCSSLPKALAKENNVKVVLPLYSSIDLVKYGITEVMHGCCVHMGNCEEFYSLYHANESGVDFLFIKFDKYFHREGIYHTKAGEYGDNPFRFSFLSKAVFQVDKDIGFIPDVIHANDWQTSLVPYYLKKDNDPYYKNTSSVLTIHNIGYQGIFGTEFIEYAGISVDDMHDNAFESFGEVNLLKGGIAFADKITTVSPKYAEEIRGPIGSSGLHEILNKRGADLSGIINGIDADVWNPSTDRDIPYNFSVKSMGGKAKNKQELQKKFGLTERPDVALFGFVGRFADQKGIYLLQHAIERAMNEMVCQFVVVGSGEQEYEDFFAGIADRFPGECASYIGYSEELAHLVEAGSDFFVMPSLYEPCGLNQMYSLAYGTLPIVRATGGLDDTVDNYDESTGQGTGFKFSAISGQALFDTIGWAVSTYYDRPQHYKAMQLRAMGKDFSWIQSAKEYLELYASIEKRDGEIYV